jgi:peptidylprolyl isomerase
MKHTHFFVFIMALLILGGALWLLSSNSSTTQPPQDPPPPPTQELDTTPITQSATTTPPMTQPHSTPIVTLSTTLGDVQIRIYTDTMPIAATNFAQLVERGFYDGTAFHRVIPGFMIQGGDPLTKDIAMKARWGTGGPGYAIQDELPQPHSNTRGTISMANSGPNTGGSQFFINVADNTFLDPKHPVFGEVISGMDVIDAIVSLPRNDRDVPNEVPVITQARIME